MSKTNEWKVLKCQFYELTHDGSAESIEDIFDAQFRRRFVDLINQVAQPDRTTSSIDWRLRH
jgi:hypothetical protein